MREAQMAALSLPNVGFATNAVYTFTFIHAYASNSFNQSTLPKLY
jgi:hypothetical protein